MTFHYENTQNYDVISHYYNTESYYYENLSHHYVV